MSDINIRVVTKQDLDRCFEIESISYAGDEAASREKILTRINTYPQGFIVLENQNEIIGFINAGATDKVELSDEEFKELVGHDSEGRHVVILSVVVHPAYQGKGMAGKLMESFITRMKALGKSDIHLICQHELIGMYAKYGFVDHGASASNHGGLQWNEMSLSLQDS